MRREFGASAGLITTTFRHGSLPLAKRPGSNSRTKARSDAPTTGSTRAGLKATSECELIMLSPFLGLSLGVVISNPHQVVDAADDNHGPVRVEPANLDFRLHGQGTRMAMSAAQTIESISTITPSITESLRTMRFFIEADRNRIEEGA
jgi:hypothetical protein